MSFKRVFLGLLVIGGVISVYSFNNDNDVIVKVNQQLEKWTENHPVEKVHLHMDKPYYAAGDNIWFKAYVTIGSQHQLSAYSGLLNVELIDNQDVVKQTLKLQLNEGTAFGDFALPDTLHEGNYRIRAYTQYMLNDGKNYIFDKAINIGNTIVNKVFTKTTFDYAHQKANSAVGTTINYSDISGTPYTGNAVAYSILLNDIVITKGKGITDSLGNLRLNLAGDNQELLTSGRIVTKLTVSDGYVVTKTIPIRALANRADVQFFPEGGNMVYGIPTKVAFKAIGTDGLGIDVKGFITDSKGADIARITTSHLGMGIFNYTPQAGDTYQANLIFPDGSKRSLVLPAAENNGYVLNISEAGPDNLRITVAAAKGTNGQINIVGQTAGKAYYSSRSFAGNAMFSAVVAKSKFPSGIAQFTLFSSSGEPLNERLVFIKNPENILNLSISSNNKTYLPRQKVMLAVSASNNNAPVLSSLSVAVTDETKVPVDENTENNIQASLLLTADLKGYVEQPAYYFNNDNDKTRTDLDMLMLTQGYRRFAWKNVLDGEPSPNKYPRETAFTISGKVTKPNGKPVAGGTVQLINYQNGVIKLDTLTDQNGRFAFKDLLYIDSIRFLINARTAKKSKDVVVTMDTIVAPSAAQYKNLPDFNIATSNSINIYAEASKKLYYEGLKYGLGNVQMLKEVHITDKFNPTKHSSNIVSPLFVTQTLLGRQLDPGWQARVIGVRFSGGVPLGVAVIIDGIRSDPTEVVRLSPNDIQAIEIIRGGAASIYGAPGAMIVTLRRGDEPLALYDIKRVETGVLRYQPKGVYVAREFYSPAYGVQTNQKLADLRTTIFWKPDLLTDNSGRASVEYFNAGSPGTYRVVIEGIDSEGNIGRQVFRYKVLN
ncbi:MAG: carboxypeptidase regulatory-like domain-containing protein [Mucilaginibacter sp.]|jgi:hypothetical protein|uniref:carboxypeptidase regulatory-like domain-containing protein n=1 Tax=Mucilaginibacter sp. TaxID=1882438 RepID=UPI0035650961